MNRTAITAAVTVGIGLAFSQPAAAVTQTRNQIQTGANMCTLSIPTTDTKVRPKASGFRNEGTTNAFVICAFDTPPGGVAPSTDLSSITLILKSLDGASHETTCTGVNSVADGSLVGAIDQQYVSKTVNVNDAGPLGAYGMQIVWGPEDFGAASGTVIPWSGGVFTVTCLLPGQVSIKVGGGQSVEDVGN